MRRRVRAFLAFLHYLVAARNGMAGA